MPRSAGAVAALLFAAGAVQVGQPELSLRVWEAVVLGLVEGITEYLPVSSTGHLLVTVELLGLNETPEAEDALDTYAICIQAGAILAVLVVYRERMQQMVEGLLGRSEEGRRVLTAVVAAFVPTAVIAVAIFPIVREELFAVGPIAWAWIVGGIAILALDRQGFFDRAGIELGAITVRQAVLIGLMQAVAVWPGVSRSLVTIIAGVLVGLNLRSSVEFSFLLGLVTLSAATAFEALRNGDQLIDTFGWVTPLIGLVVAFVSAVIAVRWMVRWLNEKGFAIFGWYRIAIGLGTFALIGAGVL